MNEDDKFQPFEPTDLTEFLRILGEYASELTELMRHPDDRPHAPTPTEGDQA